MNILTIAYAGEGNTDEKFLANIILRTFEDVLIEAKSYIEIHDPIYINKKGDSLVDKILHVAERAQDFHVLCFHADADDADDKKAFEERIDPGFNAVLISQQSLCKNLVPIVPVYMTEAWMLADIEIFKDEIGTDKTIGELGLPNRINQIEKISDPKGVINNAIKIAFEEYPNRRNVPRVKEIYLPLSQKIRLEHLKSLPSFQKFRDAVKAALIKLNYL
jgi:Domain of unknown function (DUF4276)